MILLAFWPTKLSHLFYNATFLRCNSLFLEHLHYSFAARTTILP